MIRRTALPALLLGALTASAGAQGSGRDWSEYLGGPDRSHYSKLDQINVSNVAKLKVAWEFHSGDFGQMQCNPIVVHGVLYGATGTSEIFALDAASGRQLWRFTVAGKLDAVLANDRGVTYWADGRSERILCTVGGYLYALDAKTGALVKDFGNGGKASLKAGLGPQAQNKWVMSTTPGTLYGDLLIMPTRVDEDQDAAPGQARMQARSVSNKRSARTPMDSRRRVSGSTRVPNAASMAAATVPL